MMQRKNKVKPTPITTIEDDLDLSSSLSKPSSSSSALLRKNSDQINPNCETTSSKSTTIPHHHQATSKKKAAASVVLHATVKRNTWGTQPFDKHWLNLDCCGLVCASLTYMLHVYGVYSFGWILLPPWFSVMDEDGYRELTFGCIFHRTLFITIASLAVFAHFKAMTTDPGAVPPDANPLPDLEELECLIKGEESPRVSNNNNTTTMGAQSRKNTNNSNSVSGSNNSSSLMMQDEMQQQNQQQQQQQQNGNSLSSVSQATATVAIGAAAVVVGGVAGAVATVATSAAPQKPSSSSPAPQSSSSPQQQQQQRHVHGPNCNRNNNNNALPPRGRRMCRRCNSFKPPRAHHCSICNRCIIKMDHHCPWVNNCVGIGNHKYFLLFIFYTSLSCGYSLSFLVWRFCHCTGGRGPRCVDHPTDLLPLIGLTVEALLFGLFTMCMMCDQWDVVMTNLTHIDRLKGHDTLQYRVQAGINEVFGTGRSMTSSSSSLSSSLPHHGNPAATNNYRRGFHFTWLSPLHQVCFPESVRDDIFGYCRPVSSGGGGEGGRVMVALKWVD